MSSAAATDTDTENKTAKEKYREKLQALQSKRAVKKVPKKKQQKPDAGIERLLSAKERKKMKKQARRSQDQQIEQLMTKYGITDKGLRQKVLQNIENGTLGSFADVDRFLQQEQAKMEQTKAAAANIPDTKISSSLPVSGFSLSDLRPKTTMPG